jgi:hypothetical protein
MTWLMFMKASIKGTESDSLEWNVMQFPKKDRSCIVGQQGCESVWIAYWLICGLKWEP